MTFTSIVSASENNNTRFTLPDSTTLTAGQNYNWAVQAVSSTGQSELEFGQICISEIATTQINTRQVRKSWRRARDKPF